MEIPGVGPLLASAFVASVADPQMFKTGRDLAAWIGLVPRQNSSGGTERLGGISRAGNQYLRQMLVVGASAMPDTWLHQPADCIVPETACQRRAVHTRP